MTAQFYVMTSPTDPNDNDTYIYHAKTPRFHARVVWQGNQFGLEALDNIDNADPERIQSKINRMEKWYVNVLINKKRTIKDKR